MKIWNGYGSEHSMNLVMIGRFKTVGEAEKVFVCGEAALFFKKALAFARVSGPK